MSFFGPAQSSDIYVVLKTIVETKQKIALCQEDIKETIKGLLEQHKDEITREDVKKWVDWMMNPEKLNTDFEKLEESQAKFESILANRKKVSPKEDSLDISDLD